MNLTSLTAFIITFHNLAALFMLILTLVLSLLAYGLCIRRLNNKGRALIFAMLFFTVVAFILSEKLFEQKPFNFELVQVG